MSCAICGKVENMPYTCRYCGLTFCSEHRLPEKHQCKGHFDVRPHISFTKNTDTVFVRDTVKTQTEIPIEKHANAKVIILLILVGLSVVSYMNDPVNFTTNVRSFFDQVNIQSNKIFNEINNIDINEVVEEITDELEEAEEEINKITKTVYEPKNIYGNYTFGLVKGPEGVHSNSYGDFVVLINNKNSVDPTYNQLIKFLKNDKTDEYLYQYVINMGSYYGTAESHVNITLVKGIVDGTEDMIIPRICSDFAQRLHNAAELAGIHCGYVSIDLSGYTDPSNLGISSDTGHALNVFNTTDRGLVYIDCTGGFADGPTNRDDIINNFKVGEDYIPESLFPEKGWKSTSGSMGKVVSIFITWDGEWNSR